MDYEVGSIADLISGNLTPHRQKVSQKPLTPVKIPPAVSVTPRDSSKKARTPKIALTPEVRGSAPNKRKSEKLHTESPKSEQPQKRKSKLINNFQFLSQLPDHESGLEESDSSQDDKKLKKKIKLNADKDPKTVVKDYYVDSAGNIEEFGADGSVIKKKKKDKQSPVIEDSIEVNDKNIKSNLLNATNSSLDDSLKKLTKKERKELKKQLKLQKNNHSNEEANAPENDEEKPDEIQDDAAVESEEENMTDFQKAAAKRIQQKLQRSEKFNEDEIDRTIFVGNIPVQVLKQNYERVLKGIFSKYGSIESVRIRNIPVVDFKTKPKVALIEKSFHPERSSVIAYVKFDNKTSVEKALAENNSMLEGHHIRVDKCYKNKVPVDSRKTCFLGNLPFNVEEEAIREIFQKCGEISSIRVVRDRQTQIGKGIGFVNFEKADGVELAVNMAEEDLTIGKKIIRVQRYNAPTNNKKPKKPKRNQQRGIDNQRSVPGRFQRFNEPPNKPANSFGKKRDEQGNKMRKRDLQGENNSRKRKNTSNDADAGEISNKKAKKSENDSTEVQDLATHEGVEKDPATRMEENKLKREKRTLDFKGLMAKKKKKFKIDRGVLKKKKMSKILMQMPKKTA